MGVSARIHVVPTDPILDRDEQFVMYPYFLHHWVDPPLAKVERAASPHVEMLPVQKLVYFRLGHGVSGEPVIGEVSGATEVPQDGARVLDGDAPVVDGGDRAERVYLEEILLLVFEFPDHDGLELVRDGGGAAEDEHSARRLRHHIEQHLQRHRDSRLWTARCRLFRWDLDGIQDLKSIRSPSPRRMTFVRMTTITSSLQIKVHSKYQCCWITKTGWSVAHSRSKSSFLLCD